MKSFKWKYPGNPVDVCKQYTVAEFLQVFPREPMQIITHNSVEEIPMPADLILCDFCNKECKEGEGDIFVIYNGSKGLCQECFERTVKPYIRN